MNENKEKVIITIDPKTIANNIIKSDNYLNYYLINEELKSIQRSIALLRQDISHIIRDELIRSKKSIGQEF